MADEDDIHARMRTAEQAVAQLGAGMAACQATLIGLSRTVDTFAPIVQDVHRVEATANAARDQANETSKRQDEFERTSRDDRARRIATMLTILTVIIALLGLVIVVLQFSGLGHA